MTVRSCKRVALGALVVLSAPICIQPAAAAWSTTGWTQHVITWPGTYSSQTGTVSYPKLARGHSLAQHGRTGSPLQCVPFARANSGIALVGNAATWWNSAAGVYERGARPEVGSVLNFRANGRMRLGHVAVVARVIDGRNVEIDHANWAYPGGISRAINVVDVSPQNDWTAVRVALGHANEFGSVYPTYGFIYDRADRGTLVANSDVMPAPTLNPPASDLRPAHERVLASLGHETDEEVAEAADDTQPRTHHASYSRTRFGKAPHGTAMRRVTAAMPLAVRATHARQGHPST